MIIDRLENACAYPFGSDWTATIAFLRSLSPDTAAGEYPLKGTDIFARVMDYETRDPAAAILEAHRDYADIQAVLFGREGIEWFPADTLTVKDPYDAVKDAEFYVRPRPGPARVDLIPGLFVLLFPQDAHMASLMCDDAPERIRKVVVKIRTSLLNPAAG